MAIISLFHISAPNSQLSTNLQKERMKRRVFLAGVGGNRKDSDGKDMGDHGERQR